MEKIIKVGIIDDDSSKVTQIMTRLTYGVNDATQAKRTRYSSIKLEPIEIPIKTEIDEMVEFIKLKELDCVLIDYNLASYANINYTGVELAQNVEDAFLGFPVFILTAYEDQLFDQEVFNAYQVFSFSRYLGERDERIELNYKIMEQVLKHEKQIELWKDEIEKLLPFAGKSSKIDSRILELDSLLEKSIDGKNSFSTYIKREMNTDKVSELIMKIDDLLSED